MSNEFRYVRVPQAEYDAMRSRIAEKEDLQFSRRELEVLLNLSVAALGMSNEEITEQRELRNKIYVMLREID